MTSAVIRVLVAEDSPTVCEFLTHTFGAAPGMKVVGVAKDGEEAIAAVVRMRPDIVTMDIHMPRLDGLEATRRLMHEAPVPIVIVSGAVQDQVSATFRALEAGALAFVPKPPAPDHPLHARTIAELVQTVRLMSEVRVVRRRVTPPARAPWAQPSPARRMSIEIIAIGASTGGPTAILALLAALPKEGMPPVVIVQHMATGFIEGFCDWLTSASGHAVRVAVDKQPLFPGQIYVAPDGWHLGVDLGGKAALSAAEPEHGLKPSVSHLFRSVREAYGPRAAVVLLSGMGKDGAAELLGLREAGALTFAQERESCVVFGMPGEAARLDAAQYLLAPHEIGEALAGAVRSDRREDAGG